jgi:hypothetical protein
MPAILSTIISAFTVLISFFRKIFPWINNLTSFFGGFQVIKVLKVTVLVAASTIVFGLIFEFISLLVRLFSMFINGVNSVTFALNSGSVGSCLLYWLNAFGFVDGFNLALPFALGSITAILMFLVYKYGYSIAVKIYSVVSKVF